MRQNSYILWQIVLYVSLLYLDFTHVSSYSEIIKFIVIISCLVYVWTNPIRGDWSLRNAFVFTTLSDAFLLFGGNDQVVYGVLSFIVVQQIYGYRIYKYHRKEKWAKNQRKFHKGYLCRILILLVGTWLIVGILHATMLPMEPKLVIVVFYFLSLCLNVSHAILVVFTRPRDNAFMLYTMGLLFFLLCDISVGIYNLSQYWDLKLEFSKFINANIFPLIWGFYAPSQVMISLTISLTQLENKISYNDNET